MKKIIALLLCAVLTVLLVPAAAAAADPSWVSVTNSAGLRKVFANGKGGYYRLDADITDITDKPVVIGGGVYVFDLNGHTVSGYTDGVQPLFLVNGGALGIDDYSKDGGGLIKHVVGTNGAYADPVGVNRGSLIINSGNFSGAYGTWSEGGSTVINGGTFTGDCYAVMVHGGDVEIKGGTFITAQDWVSGTAAINCSLAEGVSGSLTVSGGSFSSDGYGLFAGSGNITVSGGAFKSKEKEALCVTGGNVKISGGTFEGSTFGGLVYEKKEALSVEISGGFFTGSESGFVYNSPKAAEKCSLKGGKFTASLPDLLGAVCVLKDGKDQIADDLLAPNFTFSPAGSCEKIFEGDSYYRTKADCVNVIAGFSAPSVTVKRNYKPGMFTDVDENQWYGANESAVIAGAYEWNLMEGKGSGIFGVGANLTLAEAITVAAKIHTYKKSDDHIFLPGKTWYQPFVDYAVSEGIIKAGDFDSYSRNATRAEMAYILANCMDPSEYEAINIVEILPDVEETQKYGAEIFRLYRAGIVVGSGADGAFKPDRTITRQEAAAILLHVYDKTTRGIAEPKLRPAEASAQ